MAARAIHRPMAAIDAALGELAQVRGFSAAGVHCGLKAGDALDLALLASDRPCAAAGVFTTNRVKAAPVVYDQAALAQDAGNMRAVVANAGIANACTGAAGYAHVEQTVRLAAEALGVAPAGVLALSTGVIGVPLDMDRMAQGVTAAAGRLHAAGWPDAARAIMTTDTRPKASCRAAGGWRVGGVAKGAGMIAPDMATMLAVLVTDAQIAPPDLQRALAAAVAVSFNRIVVDGDMSTNDTVLLLANGASGVAVAGDALGAFQAALTEVCVALAQDIVRDAEGATRFVTLRVTGAPDVDSARQAAHAVATSPLVKTALYGGDPNWGRVLAAVGRSGVPVEADRLSLDVDFV
ncbi:MAG: bifunctional glutamate N-acetyltransferase/amino-acid acetyltransferase ArgJ [Anaerolineae bacterium]|nr:bifunctional glutamate N-acetyltransferase/amino-acid acetyltransferase ArgJ [Anaerolineae bacterium]